LGDDRVNRSDRFQDQKAGIEAIAEGQTA